MSTWFTADQHFGHKNIIEYANRPYSSVEEMDIDLIEQWNAVVRIGDVVYHLGDFTLGVDHTPYYVFLNGEIWFLNTSWHHDKRWIINAGVSKLPPLWVLEYPELGKDGYPLAITLCHYPLAEWDRKHYGAWHLHGHSHGNYHAEGRILDVGVDKAYQLLGKYRPFSFDEVKMYMGTVSAFEEMENR